MEEHKKRLLSAALHANACRLEPMNDRYVPYLLGSAQCASFLDRLVQSEWYSIRQLQMKGEYMRAVPTKNSNDRLSI